MRFLLPAYMNYSVKNYKNSAFASIDSPIYALDRSYDAFRGDMELLTNDQKAIAQFLMFMMLDSGDDFVDSQFASSAYEKYWGRCNVVE